MRNIYFRVGVFSVLTILLIITGMCGVAHGQRTGVVKGWIYDASTREGIPFATVVVAGTTIGGAADENGRFKIEGVPLGYMRLQATSIGYKSRLSEEYLVNTAGQRNIDLGLEPTSEELEQVTVMASPFRRTGESPMSVQRIGIAEIEKNPGGNRDISKVLQSMPGVLSSPAFRNDFVVRGGGPSENRFYLDGVELPNLNHFATQGASGGVVSIVNIDFVKEVNFYSGAFPASRGNMMSSLLEFKQMEGNPDKVKVRATVGATDFGVSLDGPLFPNTTFLVSARRSYLQFLFGMIGLPFLPVYNDFQFKTVTKFGKRHELTLLGIGAYDINNLNKDLKDPTDDQQYTLDWLPESVQWSYTVGAVYKYYGDGWQNQWVLSRSGLNNVVEKYRNNDESAGKLVDFKSGESETKLRFEHSRMLWNKVKFTVGAGIEYAEYDNRTFREMYVGNDATQVRYDRATDMMKWSLFGQASRMFAHDRLTLSLGLRADGCSYGERMSDLFQQLSPRLSLSYSLSPEWVVNGSIGRYFQLPSYTTMGYADESGSLMNKNMRYIASNQVALGVEFRPTPLTNVTVEGFYKTYGRYPVSLIDSMCLANKGTDYVAVGDEPVLSRGEGRSYGVEVMLRTQEIAGLVASVAYTYYFSEFRAMDKNLQTTSGYIPSSWDNRHIFTLTATRHLPRRWDIGLKWRFVGGSPYTPWDVDKSSRIEAWDAKRQPYIDYAQFNTQRLPSFHQLDLRVDKGWFFPRWSLTVYADVQNVYNYKAKGPATLVPEQGADGLPLKDPSREGYYRMRYIDNEIGGTLLPSVGIMVDF